MNKKGTQQINSTWGGNFGNRNLGLTGHLERKLGSGQQVVERIGVMRRDRNEVSWITEET